MSPGLPSLRKGGKDTLPDNGMAGNYGCHSILPAVAAGPCRIRYQ